MFNFSYSTGTYNKEQIKILKEMEEKCNQLLRINKDLFKQKYFHLIRYFNPVMDFDLKKKKDVLDFQKQDKLLFERINHVSQHLALRSVYTLDGPDLIR